MNVMEGEVWFPDDSTVQLLQWGQCQLPGQSDCIFCKPKELKLIHVGSGCSWRAKALQPGVNWCNWCPIITRLHVFCQDLSKCFSNDFTNRSYIMFTKPRKPTAGQDAGHSRHHTEQLPRTGAAGTQWCWGKHNARSISLLRSLGVWDQEEGLAGPKRGKSNR